jgi:peptidoglycan-associated lipoprotein
MRDTSKMGYTAADAAIRNEITTVSGQVTSLKTEVDSVKGSVAALQRDLNALRDSVGAKITALENGMQFILPVTFAYDDATVQEKDRATLDRFAQVVQKHYSGTLVTVEGFADPAGSQSYNRRLSQQRAENVIAYLEQNGLSGAKLRPVGLGETRQVVEGAERDEPGAESNRRVVFVIESASGSQSVAATPSSGSN